ncbi:piggybac transposable element-derived protein 4 [Holotrichia oblita]|uniref:Piggybac transposable element-derived protein 4 n=1 Tax=Holotrichia oblita TaxID=644536 RepID=A0ACB9TFA1_HOLOL|nr:piggybac transposable element-derived protein 4 [Holotrichia oblita]
MSRKKTELMDYSSNTSSVPENAMTVEIPELSGDSQLNVPKTTTPVQILEPCTSSIEALFREKMIYCGTLRSNRRGIPKEITNKKLKKGEVIGKENNDVKVIKWVDKRPVLMISSDQNHSATFVSTGKQNKNGDEIFKPRCVIDYNNAKKGVDYSDQMSSYHTSVRKSLKWYRKVVFELILGTTVVNAWVIYNIIAPIKMSILEFRKQLAEQLVAFNEEESSHRPALVPKKRRHTFIKPEGPGRKRRKPCRGCYQKLRETFSSRESDKRVRRVTSFCNDCENMPGFCLECFNKCHE